MDKALKIELAKIIELRVNVGELKEKYLQEQYVKNYNGIVDSIIVLLSDNSLDSFKIEQSVIKQVSGIFNPATGFRGVGDYYCERVYFLSKIDALIQYLNFDHKERQMGF